MQSTISNFFGNSSSGSTNFKNTRKNKISKNSKNNNSNGRITNNQNIDVFISKKIKKIVDKKNYKGAEKKYIESLTEKEKYAMVIAYEVLETSFNISKSVGYIKWLKKNM